MSNRDTDAYMRIALMLARRGLGTTAPNPSVGALVVDAATGEVLARAWTRAGGRPHAETEALARAGARARGATLYVTLEPCSHHGQTPPCAEAIIAAGVKRVVCGVGDPDPRVAGRGFALLRAAGIEVVAGVCEAEARWVALGHFLRLSETRPFVQLKLAVSADGRIAAGRGKPIWVTGPETRARGHLLRAQSDAILVGVGTVIADDPELTCRLPGLEARSPVRVVLDAKLRMPLGSKLVKSALQHPLKVVGGLRSVSEQPEEFAAHRRQLLAAGARRSEVAQSEDGRLDLPAVLAQLVRTNGTTRLLVEGGPHIWRSFLDAGLADEVVVFQGAGPLGPSGQLPLVDRGLEEFADTARWRLTLDRPLGGDRMTVYRNARYC